MDQRRTAVPLEMKGFRSTIDHSLRTTPWIRNQYAPLGVGADHYRTAVMHPMKGRIIRGEAPRPRSGR